MSYRHTPDRNSPAYKEGRRMAVEIDFDRTLAEAQRASEERKRARSGGDPPQTSKRGCAGRMQQRPLCGLCHEPAVIRCRECLPKEWFCGDCDVLHHKKQPLHNREAVIDVFFKAIPPTTYIMRGEGGYCTHEQACILQTVNVQSCSCEGTNFTVSPGKPVILININGKINGVMTCISHYMSVYRVSSSRTPDLKDLFRSGYWPATVNTSSLYTLDLLSSFQELKVISLGFSRQAFAKLLEHRTKCGGRVNFSSISRQNHKNNILDISAAMHCSIASWSFLMLNLRKTSSAVVNLLPGQPARQKCWLLQQMGTGSYIAFAEGLFVAKDGAVSEFVDTVRRSTQGRGTCGDSQWTAARESSRRASKLDEEGMEVAVCRHGFLLKALNMYRGEIFAYPLFLQKELMPAKAQFFAMGVASKYWPYLEKAASVLPALQVLTKMKPFLSVMHARAHATKCEIKWSGRNQEGAGTTASEEVEQVNSYLSRCALTTKYMAKAGFTENGPKKRAAAAEKVYALFPEEAAFKSK
ncbi:hypothetical protein N1851_031157 [Merluccius polli]|uniref:CxC3 like cysteine cluster domain-containing protein n=1 Tax=Merluccius polli TaxID=89951 RepID=A0AA47NQ56_MERPO|nr:hypothetical protein N1851_031157 [Merluccius polli]